MEANDSNPKNLNPPQQRWYEKQETLSSSVTLLKAFPADYQSILGDTTIKLAEKHYQADERLKNLRLLGPNAVLSMFKSKHKRRDYDKNETVHKAVNCLYVLSDDERLFIATKVIEVAGHFLEYFSICLETGQPVSKEVLQVLSTAFIQERLEDTAAHLSQFYPSMTLPNGPTLKSIRERINQSKSRGYKEEVVLFQTRFFNQDASQMSSPKDARTTPSEQDSTSDSTQISTHSKQTTSAPAKEKDETLAQDNRGMKIRLDKFDL
jgi:hypothetical protein